MKREPVPFLIFLLAGVVALAAAQSTDVKQGKGNTKHDEYMTNEFYLTKPKTADSKVDKGSSKTSKYHFDRTKGGKQTGPAPTVSPDAMPELKRSQLQQRSAVTDNSSESDGTISGKATSDLSGRRSHNPLTRGHRRK